MVLKTSVFSRTTWVFMFLSMLRGNFVFRPLTLNPSTAGLRAALST